MSSLGTVVQVGRVFEIKFAYRPLIAKEVKDLPERKFMYQEKFWTVPAVYRDEVERFARRHKLEFGHKHVNEAEQNFVIPPLPELTIEIPLKREMRPYQKTGVSYAMQKKRLIIADDMGLGKTAQSIATIIGLAQTGTVVFPCLIICPSAVKENWLKEIKDWSNYKGIILQDSIKNTFMEFFRVGMSHFFVVNYESLKKYFVERIDEPGKDANGRKKPLRINNIHFKAKYVEFFKSVIVDESHKCFPYNTKILTDKGWLNIGEIVENNMINLRVLSFNSLEKTLSLNKINNLFKNDLSGRKIYCVKHCGGQFYATENHKVFTESGRYKMVSEIKSGENLFMLPKEFYGNQVGEGYTEILLKKMRFDSKQQPTRNKDKNGCKQKEAFISKRVRVVQNRIFNTSINSKSVLQSKLFGTMENVTARICEKHKYSRKSRKEQNCSNYSNGKTCFQKNAFRKNESQQSNVKSDNIRKNEGFNERQNVLISWRKRKKYYSSNKTLRSTRVARNKYGVYNINKGCKRSICVCSKLLQSGYCNTRNKTSNRSRWFKSQNEEMEVFRQTENGNLKLVRVESCEIYQSGSNEQFERGYINREFVYDIEVDKNHNYFANGVLVSNCKSVATKTTKFTKGICTGKETILLLTGTPVVNKPKDLISQIGILDRMKDFGGYPHFTKHFCSGPKEASNLKELNYLLNIHCFYRRNKTDEDIKVYLPDKMRQVIMCELNVESRREYSFAQANLESYMREMKNRSDDEIEKSMKGEVMVRIGILKNISARGKLKDAFDFIQDTIDNGQKIVVFANLKEVIAAVQERFPNSVRVTGAENDQQKQQAVERFQHDPKIDLIVLNLKAGGVGINGLQNVATQICFIEFGWHAAIMDQAEDRLYRMGQHSNVMCTYFLGKNTIDEWNYKLINSKREIANTVTGAEDQTEESVIDGIINLFTQPKN